MLSDKLDMYPTGYESMGAGAQPTRPCGHPWLKTLLVPWQGWAQQLWLSKQPCAACGWYQCAG